MCNVCGCGEGEARIEGKSHHHHHHHQNPQSAQHTHGHAQHYSHGPDLNFGNTLAGVHVPGFSDHEVIQIEQEILTKNDGYARHNREVLKDCGIFALNLISSPGSGKTTLLTETIRALKSGLPVAVIEGDQETLNDAERIREAGAQAIQINTGRGCHLDAHMVGHALDHVTLEPGGVLFIENVGNLVCPASFALGEHHKVALLSVTEGEDKPLKYPDVFAASDLMIINKMDLLPHVDFDIATCEEYARRVNPEIEILRLSARTGDGMVDWIEWIRRAQAYSDRTVSPRPEHQVGTTPGRSA